MAPRTLLTSSSARPAPHIACESALLRRGSIACYHGPTLFASVEIGASPTDPVIHVPHAASLRSTSCSDVSQEFEEDGKQHLHL